MISNARAREGHDEAEQTGVVLIASVGRLLCALPMRFVRETMRPLPVEPVSASAAFVLGLSVIRGAPWPVVHLGRLLGADAGAPGRFVTLAYEDWRLALAVDSVVGVRTLSGASLRTAPPVLGTADDGSVEAIGALDAQLLVVLRSSRILDEHTLRALGAHGAG